MEEHKVALTPAQAAPIIAMARERELLLSEANKRIAEIQQGFQELARLYAEKLQLPVGDEWEYTFHDGEDGKMHLHAEKKEQEDDEVPSRTA